MINGIIVQNNPLKYIDPWGLTATTRNQDTPTYQEQTAATSEVPWYIAYSEVIVPVVPNNNPLARNAVSNARKRHWAASELGYGTDNPLPKTFAQLMKTQAFIDGDFEDFGYTPIHNMGGVTDNRDWRNPKTGEQYIFDVDRRLVRNPLNRGTFDKAPPKPDSAFSMIRHFIVDVAPYIAYGNAKDDPSIREERWSAYIQTFIYGNERRRLKQSNPNEVKQDTQRWIDSVTQ